MYNSTDFNSQEFAKVLHHSCFETRKKYEEITNDPIFTPRYNISLREQKDLALERLKILAKHKLFSVHDFSKNPLNVFANHEMAVLVDASMATKVFCLSSFLNKIFFPSFCFCLIISFYLINVFWYFSLLAYGPLQLIWRHCLHSRNRKTFAHSWRNWHPFNHRMFCLDCIPFKTIFLNSAFSY